ncbi:glycosyltransferase [Rothia sp. CCM 9419]|uniref:glycosyltransferase n=1 Tax=Rothia sp. CCM 9419 TaxID=3402662 RepID=UPI003AE4E963
MSDSQNMSTPSLQQQGSTSDVSGELQNQSVSYDLVVSLGTDYHKFDRLVEWVESYLLNHPTVTCLFQHGFTEGAEHATKNIDRMPRSELLKIYEEAKVVVVQGGPGSILDAREVGVIPIAVPRLAEFDEVVDNHQVQFSQVMENNGEAFVAIDARDLAQKIDEALNNPQKYLGSRRVPGADQASENLSAGLASLAQVQAGHDMRKFIRRWRQVIRGIVRS